MLLSDDQCRQRRRSGHARWLVPRDANSQQARLGAFRVEDGLHSSKRRKERIEQGIIGAYGVEARCGIKRECNDETPTRAEHAASFGDRPIPACAIAVLSAPFCPQPDNSVDRFTRKR
jgi:hypothetical protein